MAVVEIYNGPATAAVTGAWVAIPASSLYALQSTGYGSNGLFVEFSLDGVNAFTPGSSYTGAPLKGVSSTTTNSSAWTLTGVPCAYARIALPSGTPGGTNRTVLQAL